MLPLTIDVVGPELEAAKSIVCSCSVVVESQMICRSIVSLVFVVWCVSAQQQLHMHMNLHHDLGGKEELCISCVNTARSGYA